VNFQYVANEIGCRYYAIGLLHNTNTFSSHTSYWSTRHSPFFAFNFTRWLDQSFPGGASVLMNLSTVFPFLGHRHWPTFPSTSYSHLIGTREISFVSKNVTTA